MSARAMRTRMLQTGPVCASTTASLDRLTHSPWRVSDFGGEGVDLDFGGLPDVDAFETVLLGQAFLPDRALSVFGPSGDDGQDAPEPIDRLSGAVAFGGLRSSDRVSRPRCRPVRTGASAAIR